MNRVKLFVLISVIAAFAAGISIGMVIGGFNKKAQRKSRLSRELHLTSKQRDQMKKIWSEGIRTARRVQREQRQKLHKERDEAIEAILTDEQKTWFKEIISEYSQKIDELAQSRECVFKEAVEQTKRILSEEQRKKYEELLKEQEKRGWKYSRP
ncbi:MAG: hypothetical protein JSW12_19685 [Deltaproteobacteria bacterium]|nr:MAG: hypothetical protein JSW12_19685 [Deltaproteobacteria bacterium]